jgi:uncharacterized protein YndB with AHSA1/START domain
MTTPTAPADRTIVTTRVIDAPRELVFKAWTDPDHIAEWWGPDGFTTTIREMDVRLGGAWRFIMHGPDGVDYPNLVVYTEIVPPERIAFDHSDDGGGEHKFHNTVTFVEEGGKTRVTMEGVFESAAERQRHVDEFGAIEGGKQTLARLAEFLEAR